MSILPYRLVRHKNTFMYSIEGDLSMARLSTAEKKKKRNKIIIIVAIVLAIITVAVIIVRKRVDAKFGSKDELRYETTVVKRGSLSTFVSGSGNLEDEDIEDICLPDGVELTEIVVADGDLVKEGDLLAKADMGSVMNAMSALQKDIDSLDEDIAKAADKTAKTFISSPVKGRIKQLYLGNGDSVTDAMLEHGCIAVISLDGYMAVDIESGSLKLNDKVTVSVESGKEYSGRVDTVSDGKATVLITDDGPLNGENVSVKNTAGGSVIGSGTLYIHKPMKVTAYAGKVDLCHVKENTQLYEGSAIYSLSDTGYKADYESLLRTRGEYEEDMSELIAMYINGGITAPFDGEIDKVDDTLDDPVKKKEADNTAAASAAASASASASASSSASMYAAMSGAMTGAMPASASASTTAAASASAASAGKTEEKETVLCTLAPNKTVKIKLSIDEANILSLSVGQRADITCSSIGDDVFEGKLTEINKIGTSSAGVTRYTAEVTADKDSRMLSGMTATVKIIIEGKDNALIIPHDALKQTSTTSYVYTSYDAEKAELSGMVEVEAGIVTDDYAEIISGLSEGDTVLYVKKRSGFPFGMMSYSSDGESDY